MEETKMPPRTGVADTAVPCCMLPAAQLNVFPCMTTLTEPNGTFAVGDRRMWLPPPTPNWPVESGVNEEWLVATPESVMLPPVTAVLANPCPATYSDVGAVPRKLNVVPPFKVL